MYGDSWTISKHYSVITLNAWRKPRKTPVTIAKTSSYIRTGHHSSKIQTHNSYNKLLVSLSRKDSNVTYFKILPPEFTWND